MTLTSFAKQLEQGPGASTGPQPLGMAVKRAVPSSWTKVYVHLRSKEMAEHRVWEHRLWTLPGFIPRLAAV
jgi:hypothetical protein